MLLFSSDVLIEYYIFRISQLLLVPSTFPKKFLYFTRKSLKLDSSIYSIFETNLSVLWLNFSNIFTYSQETFEFYCNFMHLFPNHKNFAFTYFALKSSQLIVFFNFILVIFTGDMLSGYS